MGKRDANIVGHIVKLQLRQSIASFWPEISRPGCSLLNAYHLAFQDFYLPPLPMLHSR